LPKPAKIKSFLIEKFLSLALIKTKIFAGFGSWHQLTFRKRWAGLSPCGQTTCLPAGRSKVGIGILFKIGSNFVQKTPLYFHSNKISRKNQPFFAAAFRLDRNVGFCYSVFSVSS